MEFRADMSYSKRAFSKTAKWDMTKEAISLKYETITMKVKETQTRKKRMMSNEMFHHKATRSGISNQSPIVKAYNNFDEFYKSIRPVRVKTKKDSFSDSIFRDKPEIMVSYYSKRSSNVEDQVEDEEKVEKEVFLSSIINQTQLSHFLTRITQDILIKENEEY